jgi:hypothetical protein
MPGLLKRVHFAPDVHPNRARTPSAASPALSDSSLPSVSSSSPRTPSPTPSSLPEMDSPLSARSMSSSAEPAHVHYALAYRPGMHGALEWDVSHAPPTARSPERGLDAASLAEPATNPPLAGMTLLSPALPWKISVRANMAADGPGFVTVADVLSSVYAALRAPLTQAEYAAHTAERRAALDRAYYDRCERAPDAGRRDRERSKGVKRVDTLLASKETVFDGLGATKSSRSVWVLNLR